VTHGIYVHVPWCRVHCPYCAFNVAVDKSPPWSAYVQAVLRDQGRQAPRFAGPADTLYFGGGTPSLLPIPYLRALLDGLNTSPEAEITLEVNPGTVDLAYLRQAVDAGVTRLSLGIQTFSRRHAQRLARDHDVRQAEGLLSWIGDLPLQTWSLDLIFALPGQTLAELNADLDRVVDIAPPHVSIYGLTYEPGTAFADRLRQGRLQEQPPEAWRAMYDQTRQRLDEGGWRRYEISNFARMGHRSRHNSATWRAGHYLGLGPGAHAFLPPDTAARWGERRVQVANIDSWLAGAAPEVETLDARTSASDLVLSTLRHVDGLPLDALRGHGFCVDDAVVDGLIHTGLIASDQASLVLTEAGVPMADGVTARLIQSLRPSAERT